jgi:hypothetical protein
MANNNLSSNENILVKVDQNNLIYIDPNSVVDKDGFVKPREVNPEQLVIYANLEADIVPRSILAATNDQNTLVSIAKGTLNFLSNQNGEDYDSSWTDAYTEFKPKQKKDSDKTNEFYSNDSTGQSFGIDNISITIKGANAIPQVNISFIDIRGKTLFESASNSPYNAFFHIPWPIFYLTLKGYYGKAIRYRLHLVKFSSKYNDNNGNFEIQTVFVGSTFAYLNDISLKAILNCPYMYMVENIKQRSENAETGEVTKYITASSRGYVELKKIYEEYKRKGLISQNFPVVTLRELIVKAQSLDKILEKKILNEKLHPDIFVGLQEFEERVKYFYDAAKAWASVNLLSSRVQTKFNNVDVDEYDLKTNPNTTKSIKGNTEGTLEYLIIENNKNINNSKLLTDELIKEAGKIRGTDFNKVKLLTKNVSNVDKYYNPSTFRVRIDLLIEDIDEIRKTFNEQNDNLQRVIEEEMNKIILNKDIGFGFEPTIRNIFAVILANADVYIRLMKDVHKKAFEKSSERKNRLLKFSNETPKDGPIYPWPEVKKEIDGGKSKVIAYPAEKDLVKKLESDNFSLWPEVEFIENFLAVATNKLDTNSEKENTTQKITLKFVNDGNQNSYNLISSLEYINDIIPYVDKTPSSFLYEIYERANQFTMVDSFNFFNFKNKSLYQFAKLEFDNIVKALEDDYTTLTILRDGITSESSFDNFLQSYSPFERYPYYKDKLPTTKYLQDNLDSPYEIKQYSQDNRIVNSSDYLDINSSLKLYNAQNYRKDIYPFNSDTYLSYLRLNEFSINELKPNGVLKVDEKEAFIVSPQLPTAWVKTGFRNGNLFSNPIINNTTKSLILNTPYFHKQLYNDFFKTSSYGKYSGSAYLLLNSLPFLDLEDKIDFTNTQEAFTPIRMSSLFRDVGSTHYIPYHLICKWGSIYHRYKKYILEGVDILDGFLSTANKSTPIDGLLFFNDEKTEQNFTKFTYKGENITYSGSTDIGVHPYYDAIYHQIINGYNHFEFLSGNTSFSYNADQGAIVMLKRTKNLNYWTSFVDNNIFDVNDNRYTFLPCDGADNNITKITSVSNLGTTTQNSSIVDSFDSALQKYFKVIWEDNVINDNYENKKFPSPDEYFKTYSTTALLDSLYALDSDYRKVLDLIGTFSPTILDEFEDIFLRFATEKISETLTDQKFPNTKYTNFQTLLKGMLSVDKESSDSTTPTNILINNLKERQQKKLTNISNEILSLQNTLKFTLGNPKEINYHVWHGFSNMDNVNTFSTNDYNSSQLTNENKKYIKLYLGEDVDLSYQNFFIVNNVELSQNNILELRPLIQIYAGYVKSGEPNNKSTFQTYLRENIFNGPNGANQRRINFLNELSKNFKNLKIKETTNGSTKIVSGYETDIVKVENYNYFKSFNDKWIGGNSIGQRLLLEEFLFLDKANKDIGDKLYLNIDRLIELGKQDYDKTNLYSVIAVLIKDSGIDMRPLPAYVNFYGTNYNNKTKIIPSKRVAKDLFGTYLEVDYQDSSPKIILQLVGQTSKHLDIPSKKYKFADDSFNISSTNKNPLIVLPEVFNNLDLSKSNRVVAFEVSFGDQNQSIFKGVQLDQTSLKNTSESFVVIENIARSESGAGAYNVDISLFDYYRQASYTCDVTCMGNVMIQPTMYFYLKNIPMFKGSYWITEVTHTIRGNNFTTSFKGARIPYASLPDPKDSFVSSYRVLFDRLKQNTIFKQKAAEAGRVNVTKNITSNGKTYQINIGQEARNEDFDKIKVNRSGITEFGIPFNGHPINEYQSVSTIQMVKYAHRGETEREWLRARVFEYGSNIEQFKIKDEDIMQVISLLSNQSKLKWSEIKNTNKTSNFYSTILFEPSKNAQKIRQATTIFVNPENSSIITVPSTIAGSAGNRVVTGMIDTTVFENFGIGLSKSIMNQLNFNNGSIVYFRMQ